MSDMYFFTPFGCNNYDAHTFRSVIVPLTVSYSDVCLSKDIYYRIKVLSKKKTQLASYFLNKIPTALQI
jgi:hypothetical protein